MKSYMTWNENYSVALYSQYSAYLQFALKIKQLGKVVKSFTDACQCNLEKGHGPFSFLLTQINFNISMDK